MGHPSNYVRVKIQPVCTNGRGNLVLELSSRGDYSGAHAFRNLLSGVCLKPKHGWLWCGRFLLQRDPRVDTSHY